MLVRRRSASITTFSPPPPPVPGRPYHGLQRNSRPEDHEPDRRADEAPAEYPEPGELAETHVREQDGDHGEPEFDHEESHGHGPKETRLSQGAIQDGHDPRAVRDVEHVVHHREPWNPAQHVERAERLARDRVDQSEPDPDARRYAEPELHALPQGIVFARHHLTSAVRWGAGRSFAVTASASRTS